MTQTPSFQQFNNEKAFMSYKNLSVRAFTLYISQSGRRNVDGLQVELVDRLHLPKTIKRRTMSYSSVENNINTKIFYYMIMCYSDTKTIYKKSPKPAKV